MLLEFTVNNFRSLKDDVKLSMVASSKDIGNCFKIKKYNLLKSAVIYGANASGKSNFLKAMSFMSEFVLNKYKIIQSTDKLPHEPFKLSNETDQHSSRFEIIFFIDNTKYRYGFEIDSEVVYSEWLYSSVTDREAKLFYRDLNEKEHVNPDKFKEGFSFFDNKNKKIKISKNLLFIWKCDQENGEISHKILKWFGQLNSMSLGNNAFSMHLTMEYMKNKKLREKIVNLIKTTDIGIDDIQIQKEKISSKEISQIAKDLGIKVEKLDGIQENSLKTIHKKFDKDGNIIDNILFDLANNESDGTNKLFAISAPILDALEHGQVIIIDELDSSLHPALTQYLVKLFHNDDINKNNAQLIFTTHDINLLKETLFRRDQIWFSEKSKYGDTDLYSLAQIKNVRKDEDFNKQYIHGKYGALPYIGKFEI